VALTSIFLVELPGIEPVAEIALTCRDAESDDAKVRETTRNDLQIRRRCLWHQRPDEPPQDVSRVGEISWRWPLSHTHYGIAEVKTPRTGCSV
jgi:hypothetical protein